MVKICQDCDTLQEKGAKLCPRGCCVNCCKENCVADGEDHNRKVEV